MFRMLCCLEKHKTGGVFFSSRLRDVATYYAVKYHYKDGTAPDLNFGSDISTII
jgi:hypothetical protein